MPPGIFIGISIVKINPVVNEMEDGKYMVDDGGKFLIDDNGKYIVE